jgi:hypothetical protein
MASLSRVRDGSSLASAAGGRGGHCRFFGAFCLPKFRTNRQDAKNAKEKQERRKEKKSGEKIKEQ